MVGGKEILIDTCIISNLLSRQKDLRNKTKILLNKLIINDNKLYISEYTHYEILRGIKESKKEKAEQYLNYFITVPNSKDRLKRATQLHSAYSKYKKVKNFLHSISDIDIFIASLIFTEQKPLLLTADFCDFPRPFFSEVEHKRIDYKKSKGVLASLYYYFLNANLDTLFKKL